MLVLGRIEQEHEHHRKRLIQVSNNCRQGLALLGEVSNAWYYRRPCENGIVVVLVVKLGLLDSEDESEDDDERDVGGYQERSHCLVSAQAF